MNTFKHKVAVITGAASGIGRSLAEKCADEGMKVVLADIERDALAQVESDLKQKGAEVLSLVTDVAQASDMQTLAQTSIHTFGAVHLLCLNAGVATNGPIWENTVKDWEWVLGVNLWGVIHGIRVFVPLMLAQKEESHIVNTASILGISSMNDLGVYQVAKHGVVALSETLHLDLKKQEAKIGVSVLCPDAVNTQIVESSRNRSPALSNETPAIEAKRSEALQESGVVDSIRAGMAPSEVADLVFAAVRSKKLYIFTHPDTDQNISKRFDRIMDEIPTL